MAKVGLFFFVVHCRWCGTSLHIELSTFVVCILYFCNFSFFVPFGKPLKRFFLSQKTIVVQPQYITYRDDFHRSLKSGLRSAGKERAPLLVRVVTMWFPGL